MTEDDRSDSHPPGYPDDLPEVRGGGRWHRLTTEPRRAARVRRRADAHWFTVAAVCVGAFMGQLDASIVTLALPNLQRQFHADLGSVTWVGLSYLVTLVAVVPVVGRISDVAGRKLVYTYGFLVFVAGSAACGLAPGLAWLVVFRSVQALGAAMLQANSVAIIYLVMPAGLLGRGIGIQGAFQALGLALGPTVGGALIAVAGWRSIFLVNVPVGVAGAVLGRLFIPRSRHLIRRGPFDVTGLLLLVPASVALLWAVSFGDSRGWTSTEVVATFVLGGLAAAAFVARERRAASPLVDLRLFAAPGFSAGVASGLLAYVVLFGVLFEVPFYLERARGLGAGPTGLVLTALPVALGAVAPLGGRLSDRYGARAVTGGGMAVATACLALLGPGRGSTAITAALLAGTGVGLGLFTPANNAAVMSAARREQAGLAGGLLNMTRGLGTALGLAVTSLVVGVAAGPPAPTAGGAGGPGQGFLRASVMLAGLAAAAAVLAAGRRSGAPTSRPGSGPPPPGI